MHRPARVMTTGNTLYSSVYTFVCVYVHMYIPVLVDNSISCLLIMVLAGLLQEANVELTFV